MHVPCARHDSSARRRRDRPVAACAAVRQLSHERTAATPAKTGWCSERSRFSWTRLVRPLQGPGACISRRGVALLRPCDHRAPCQQGSPRSRLFDQLPGSGATDGREAWRSMSIGRNVFATRRRPETRGPVLRSRRRTRGSCIEVPSLVSPRLRGREVERAMAEERLRSEAEESGPGDRLRLRFGSSFYSGSGRPGRTRSTTSSVR
jgi:hypothetical protein